MRRTARELFRSLALLVATVLWPSHSAVAQDVGLQDVALARRGPRFMVVSSSHGTPVEIDARSSAVLRRPISLQLDRPTVGRVLSAIERQTGLRFAFTRDLLSPERPVALRADSITVAAALMELLIDTDVDVLLSAGRQVTLVRRSPSMPPPVGAITGRVTDAKTQTALAGATVVVQGTSHSATTGSDGRYRIAAVAPGTYTVRARYIGYAPGAVSVTVSADQEATADLSLQKSAQQLEQVVVTGSVSDAREKELPSPIAVITSETIQEKNVQRVDQLLRGDIPGVFAWDRGSGNYYSTINVRGTSALPGTLNGSAPSAVKTYLDGIEIVDPAFIATLDPNSIDRIELIRGPQASTLYGAQALNGVMQIFTKSGSPLDRTSFYAQASAGPVQSKWVSRGAALQQNYTASISGGTSAFSYNVGASRIHTGEWVDEYYNTGSSLFGKIRGTQGRLSVELSGRFYNLDQGEPLLPVLEPFAGAPYFQSPVNQIQTLQEGSYGLTLQYQASPRWRHTAVIGFDRMLQDIFNPRPTFHTPADSFVTIYDAEEHKLSLRYYTSLDVSLGARVSANMTGGVDHYYFRSNDLGIASVRSTGSLEGNLYYADRNKYFNTGYFAQGRIGLVDALFVTAGLRAEQNDNFGTDYGLAWAPRVGASYNFNVGAVALKARASYGKAIRPPDPGQGQASANAYRRILANPNLGPEAQRGWDAGLEIYPSSRTSLEMTYYDQQAEGLIDRVLIHPDSIPAQYQNQNVGEVRNRGWEFAARIQPLKGLSLDGTYSITLSTVDAVSPSYTGDLRLGDHLLGIPKHAGAAGVSYALPSGGIRLGMTYVGSWVEKNWADLFAYYLGAAPFRGSGRDYWITYPAFTKWNLVISHRLTGQVTGFINVDNLGNNYAFEGDNFNAVPGRTTMVGVRARF